MSAQPDERERYDAAHLSAFEDHDRTSPIWRYRSMAWALAQAMRMPLPDPKASLRVKVSAEIGVLEHHLREFRHAIPRRVEFEISTALGELNEALLALNAPRPRRRCR